MPGSNYTRNITIYINGKQVSNDIKSIRGEMKHLINAQAKMTRGSKEYNQAGAEIKKLNKILTNHRNSLRATSKGWAIIKSVLPIASISALIYGLGRLGKNLYDTARQMQGESKRAAIVFGDELEYVQEKADLMSKKMGVTNHQFTTMAANIADLLIPLDFTREQAAQMSVELQGLTGALDEWTSGSIGAEEVSNILTKAMLGENEQLKRLGIAIRQDSEEFRNLVKQKKEAQGVTDGQARAMATLELIQKKSADAQAAYNQEGNKLLRTQKEISRWFRQTKENVIGLFDVNESLSEQLNKQRFQMNTYFKILQDGNTPLEYAERIRKKLNEQYKEYLPYLIEEKTSLEDIKKAQEQANLKLLERIKLEASRETLTAKYKAVQDIQNEIFEQEIKYEKKVAKFQEEMATKGAVLKSTRAYNASVLAEIDLNKLRVKLKEAQEEYNKFYVKIMADSPDLLTEETPPPLSGISSGLTEEEKKAVEQALIELQELANEYYLNKKDQDEQELQRIIEKWDTHIAKAKEAGATEEELLKYKDLQTQEYMDKWGEQQEVFLDELIANKERQIKEESELLNTQLEEEEKAHLERIMRSHKEREEIIKDKEEMLNTSVEIARELGSLLGSTIAKSQATFKNAMAIMTLTILKALKNLLITAIVEVTIRSLKSAESVGSWGLLGIVKAAVMVGLLEAAYAGIEAVVKNNMNQYAKGRYPIRGADDGRLYHARAIGPVRESGIQNAGQPALINEQGGEMILTAPHTRQLMLNPGLYKKVMNLSPNQYAEGNYPINENSTTQELNGQLRDELNRLNESITKLAKKSNRSYIVFQDIEKAINEMDDIEEYAEGN